MFNQFLSDFLNLFYPITCAVCGRRLVNETDLLCLTCEVGLPKTNFETIRENPVEKKFWGRCHLKAASSFLYFEEKNSTQKLLHLLKYKGREDIGTHLGKLMAYTLTNSIFKDAEIIFPMPIHPTKKRSRGYNQAEAIARGVSEVLQIPLDTSIVLKEKYTATQTNKSRIARFENVVDSFGIKNATNITGKNILLVDDVITTGATLEALILEIEKHHPKEIFVLSVACAV